jgi:hypothetical protein
VRFARTHWWCVSANRARALVASAVAATTLVAAAPAGAAAPVVDQMVVFKDGSAKIGTVRASATRVKVGRQRCAVGAGTPLAALVRGKAGTLRFTDYGSCGKRSRDAGGLYVRGIARDIAPQIGEDGWVYKVGNKAAPAGAADPSGPFGRGLLRSRQRVTWFWCDAEPGVEGCQRTLELKITGTAAGGIVHVRVRGYDNSGRGIAVEGATVTAAGVTATTDAAGEATLTLPFGRHAVVATKPGLVRSYPAEADVL